MARISILLIQWNVLKAHIFRQNKAIAEIISRLIDSLKTNYNKKKQKTILIIGKFVSNIKQKMPNIAMGPVS